MTRYAEGTTVSVDRTQGEIRQLLLRAGATHYAVGEAPEKAMVQFALGGRHYRFEVIRPSIDDVQGFYSRTPTNGWNWAVDAEWRRRWRARLLWIKAQIEFAEGEPGALEEAMLAHLVLPDGRTLGG